MENDYNKVKSHNSLKFVSVETGVVETGSIVFFEAKMKSELKLLCPETGINFKTVFFSTVGRGNTLIESVIEALQNFNIGLMKVFLESYNIGEIKCVPQYNSIDHFEIELASPYPELFNKYVDLAGWQNHISHLFGKSYI